MDIKNTIKGFLNTVRILIKLALVILLVIGSFVYLEKAFANKEIDRADGFHALPENSLDIGVLGSSHSQYSFIPNYLYNDLGLYSYVLGTPCQPLPVSYELLKEIYKTQNPKLIVLEVYTAMPLSAACGGDNCYVAAAYQATGEEKDNILSMLPEEKANSYRNEFINNHNNWRNIQTLEELTPLELPPLESTSNSFGYIDAYPSFPVDNYWSPLRYDSDIEVELKEKDQKALDGILNLCKEHGSELLLYKTPVDGITQEDQSYLHKVWEWVDNNNIKHISFIDLADELGYHMQTHTNSGHAYINGASIISNYLSDYIKDNYLDIFIHKQNNTIDIKHENMTYEYLKGSSMVEYNPLVYLNRVAKYKGVIVIRYNRWAGTMSNELINKFDSIGLPEGFSNNSYYAIYVDGKPVIESIEPFEKEVNGRLIKVDTDHVYLEGTEIENWTGAPMSITIFNNKIDNWFIKRINTQTNWEFGYTFYGE